MNTDTDDIEFRKYLAVLTRWWWILMLIPIIFGSLAFLYSGTQTPMYRASEDILVQQARSGLLGPAIPGANEDLARTYSALASTKRLLKQTQVELGLSVIPKAKASGKGSVLRVSGEHPDPVMARDIASKLSELLIRDIQTSQLLEIARLESLAESQGIPVDREVLQAQMLTIDSLRVIDSAEIPLAPFAPSTVRNTVLGVAVGLMLAVMAAFLFEYFSRKVRSIEQLDQVFYGEAGNIPALGMISRWRGAESPNNNLVVIDHPSGPHAEMFRQLRSGFHFARFSQGADSSGAYLVTSAVPKDGKTTISSNLAVVLAQAGNRVILVDGDLRRPSLHTVFGVSNGDSGVVRGGLCSLLVDGERPAADELLDVGVPGLKLLPCGDAPMNPADLLSLPSVGTVFQQLRSMCDLLLVDSSPVLATVDPLLLAGFVDGVILTVNIADSRLDLLREAYLQVDRAGTPILGYVVNNVASGFGGYSRYYQRYGYAQKDGHGPQVKGSPSQESPSANGPGSDVVNPDEANQSDGVQ